MVAFFGVPLTWIKVTVLPLAKRDFNSMKNMHFDNELLMKSTGMRWASCISVMQKVKTCPKHMVHYSLLAKKTQNSCGTCAISLPYTYSQTSNKNIQLHIWAEFTLVWSKICKKQKCTAIMIRNLIYMANMMQPSATADYKLIDYIIR